MTKFESANGYFHFAHSVQRQWRFVRSDAQNRFLAAVLASSQSRHLEINLGALLYRAQVGCIESENDDDPEPHPFGVARMKPQPHLVGDGRVNSRGIPCLYLATDPETAVAECRPWTGASVSVAQMETVRLLHVLDCTKSKGKRNFYFSEPAPAERERACWADIDRAFARPVERSDTSADYAPTQVIAEMFRKQGLDGIYYRSSLAEGHNLALFDLSAADVHACVVWSVDKIRIESSQSGNPHIGLKKTD